MKMRLLFLLIILAPAVLAVEANNPSLNDFVATLTFKEHIKEIQPIDRLGLYALILNDGQIFYADVDKKMLVKGDIYQISTDQVHYISRDIEQQKGREAFEAIRSLQPIAYPAQEEKLSVVVFTDTECPFCQKFHKDIEEFQEQGVTVLYAAYPRAGVESEGYRALVNIWCAADRQKAMDRLKSRRRVPDNNCDNPVAEHFQLGRYAGVRGTPAILMEDGTMVTGYTNVDDLVKRLGLE